MRKDMKVTKVTTERFETQERGIEYRVTIHVDRGDFRFSDTYQDSVGFHVEDMIRKLLDYLGYTQTQVRHEAASGSFQVYLPLPN